MTETSHSFSLPSRLALLALLSLTSSFLLWKSRRLRRLRLSSQNPNPDPIPRGKLFFASQTGTSRALAGRLAERLRAAGFPFDLVDPRGYEPEDLSKETLVLIVASTWEDGKPPPNAEFLARWLAESAEDFRVGSLLLSRCRFAVFGVGSRSYGETFNATAKDFSRWMRAVGAAEMLPIWEGDVDNGDVDEVFDSWSQKVIGLLKGDVRENGGHLASTPESNGFDSEVEEEEEAMDSAAVDMEDIAGKAPSRKSTGALSNGGQNGDNGLRDMVTPIIRTSLEKQVIPLHCFLLF